MIAAILQREPLPLARHAPAVPTEVELMVTKALRKDPAERYETATELLADLKSLRHRLEV
jgi:serine/threonine-protein kinase